MNQRARSISALLVLGILAAVAQAQTSVPFEWEKLEGVWNRAHLQSDTAALDALWADDITIVIPGMAPLGKSDALKMWQSVPVKSASIRVASAVPTLPNVPRPPRGELKSPCVLICVGGVLPGDGAWIARCAGPHAASNSCAAADSGMGSESACPMG